MDRYGYDDPYFSPHDERRRRRRDPHEGPHLTGEDWAKSRKPTGWGSGYRWVDPARENRTKADWPYSYSDHYLWGTQQKGDQAVYSDRLHQWSSEAWERACAAVPRKRLDQFSHVDADKFMSAYYEKPIKVTALAEGCNVSNGYPYWILWFRDASLNPHQQPEKSQ